MATGALTEVHTCIESVDSPFWMIVYRSAGRGQWVAADIQLGGRVCSECAMSEWRGDCSNGNCDGRREGKASLFTAAPLAASIRARVVRPRRQRRWPQCPRPPLARSHLTLITRFAEGGREGQRDGPKDIKKEKEAGHGQPASSSPSVVSPASRMGT